MPWLTPNNTPTTRRRRRVLSIPDDLLWVAAVTGALVEMTKRWNWEAFGEVAPEEAAETAKIMLEEYLMSDFKTVGILQPIIAQQPPEGALWANGDIHQRADWPDLYDVLANQLPTLIISETAFNVPDLRGLFLLPGDDYAVAGNASVTLTIDNLPSHSHTTVPHSHSVMSVIPFPDLAGELPTGGLAQSIASTSAETVVVNATGGGQSFSILPPHLVTRWIIWGW